MSDILISKNLPALTAFFAISKPTAYSTPYFLKRNNELIPWFGYSISDSYPRGGIFKVFVSDSTGSNQLPILVLPTDEIYHSTNRFILSGSAMKSNDLMLLNYATISFQELSAFADPDSLINKNNPLKPNIRINKNSIYKNTHEDKGLIKIHLTNKVNDINTLTDEKYGTKNLIYFTLFNDPAYVEVLNICLKSIDKNTPTKNFDVLIITDEATKPLLSQLQVLSSFNVKYLLQGQITDPIAASAQKLRITEFTEINDYKKILFLDADILLFGDINSFFIDDIEDNYLDVVKVDGGNPVSTNHSLKFFDETELNYIMNNRILPFNAGHFLFNNTKKMQEHFNVVYWLYLVWPGAYFYEQSFMNYYFNIFVKNTKFNVIDKYIQIGLEDKVQSKAVHFVGGNSKIDAMNAYLINKNICL